MYEAISPKCRHLLHGGDYNPEQWLQSPEILDEDMRLMKEAGCNVVSIGIFSWAMLEPSEGVYDFSWLDNVMDRLAENNIYALLATPSASRPAWMSEKYPEVLRVQPDRVRVLHGRRSNHCYTSRIYREKTRQINEKLAERYKNHPALIMWHVSNEYGGECHCELCREAFREWLKNKYHNDLNELNLAWWTAFWGHTYSSWSQIEPPNTYNGEIGIHGLVLDWKRFVTAQTIDFMKNEIEPLRRITPDIPLTSNFMGAYPGLDYWRFAPYLDVISWDSYPQWHGREAVWKTACRTGFLHDLNRSLKNGKPFMLMECAPSTPIHPVSKLKRPGMNLLSAMQAIAHGSDTVQYFQWRKGRGGYEKFHGAVVDHCGHENTRVFSEVKEIGKTLKELDCLAAATVKPEVAIIYDWENRWAIEEFQGLRKDTRDYLNTAQNHYEYFWKNGIPADIIEMECDFSQYKLLIAPMLYMLKPETAWRIEEFTKNGGTFVATYLSGIADQNDLCFLGGFPGPLSDVLGIWSEETDALYDQDKNYVDTDCRSFFKRQQRYEVKLYCDLIHTKTAKTLAVYEKDFYAGRPAVTVNDFGKGQAYYIAFRSDTDFLNDFYAALDDKLCLNRVIDYLPEGVTAQVRKNDKEEYIFLLNFTEIPQKVRIGNGKLFNLLTKKEITKEIILDKYEAAVFRR